MVHILEQSPVANYPRLFEITNSTVPAESPAGDSACIKIANIFYILPVCPYNNKSPKGTVHILEQSPVANWPRLFEITNSCSYNV
jgi:hypothetical protein